MKHLRLRIPFMVATLLLALIPTLQAIPIAKESFEYEAGPLAGKNGGIGWKGAWFTSPKNSQGNQVEKKDMSYPGLKSCGGRNLQIGSDVRDFRYIDTDRPELASLVEPGPYGKVLGKDGTTVWIVMVIASKSPTPTTYGGMHLNNGVGDLTIDIFGDKKLHQVIQLGRQNKDPHWLLCRVTNGGPGAGTWPGTVIADDKPRLLVYRFDFKLGAEEAWMWVDPSVTSEPDPSKADLHTTEVSDFRFNAVNIGSKETFYMDELRVGSTYADVVP